MAQTKSIQIENPVVSVCGISVVAIMIMGNMTATITHRYEKNKNLNQHFQIKMNKSKLIKESQNFLA